MTSEDLEYKVWVVFCHKLYKKKKIHVVTRDYWSRLKNTQFNLMFLDWNLQAIFFKYPIPIFSVVRFLFYLFICLFVYIYLLFLFIYFYRLNVSVLIHCNCIEWPFPFHRKQVGQNMTVSKLWYCGQIPLIMCIGFIIKHSAFLDTLHKCNLLLRQKYLYMQEGLFVCMPC